MNHTEFTIMKPGWARVGQTVIVNQGLLEVRNMNLIVTAQALIGIAERLPKTRLVRVPLEWVDGTGTILSESPAVYGLAQDMVQARYVQEVWVTPFLEQLETVLCLVIDPSHPEELLAACRIPSPFDVDMDAPPRIRRKAG